MSQTNRRNFAIGAGLLTVPICLFNGFMWGMSFQKIRDSLNSQQITADKEATVADKEAAVADKEAAVQQMAAQIADDSSNIRTVGFRDLIDKNPWLAKAGKTVGHFDSGTAILIDYDGTIALCAHERRSQNPSVTFWPTDNIACKATVQNVTYDQEHDVMFGSISPNFISQYGLKPVSWSTIGYDNSSEGLDIVAVGWPDPSHRLHAVTGKIASFVGALQTKQGQIKCKTAGYFVAFPGMSGGGVFYQGGLVGIINSRTGLGNTAKTYFTPSDFIYTAYEELFPDRARKAGFPAIQEAKLPEDCQFNRRKFLGGVFAPR